MNGENAFGKGTSIKIVKPQTVFLDVKPSALHVNSQSNYGNSNSFHKPKNALHGLTQGNFMTSSSANLQSLLADVVYKTMRPTYFYLKALGVMPIQRDQPGNAVFTTVSSASGYSLMFFSILMIYVIYVAVNRFRIVTSLEGRFEESVIAYIFLVNILPIFIMPIMCIESRKLARVMNDWNDFELVYYSISGRNLPLKNGKKSLVIAIIFPILSIFSVVITQITMAEFKLLQVIPYCILDNLTVMLGVYWYLMMMILSKSAFILAEDFQMALRHIGPAHRVADFRAIWLRLSKLTRDCGNATCYTFVYLNLYLFFIITLSIYGLLSKISEGFGIKDIGLAVTAMSSVCLLYFICNEAHTVTQHVRTNFQKRLLMVELSWMNADAQTEINMFLRATEMNPSNINCGGFFDVNRNLFKSLLTTMVTYLVVLLQFQISIPEDRTTSDMMGNITSTSDTPSVKN